MQNTHTHMIYDANLRGLRQGGVCVDVETVCLDGALGPWGNVKNFGVFIKIPLGGRSFGHHPFGNFIEVILCLCCVRRVVSSRSRQNDRLTYDSVGEICRTRKQL